MFSKKDALIPGTGPRGSGQRVMVGGYSLIEVLISIAVFAFGLLALVQLQGSLSRSAADANQRTVAANMAEEFMERWRGFARLSTDPDGAVPAYADIVDGQRYFYRGGIQYKVETDVQDYWYSGDSVTSTAPAGRPLSDFKRVTIEVSWGGDQPQEFRIDDGTRATLGSGSIRLTDVISSTTSTVSSRSLAVGDLSGEGPEVQYDPGSRPDVISISLGNNRFKESTVPLPDVIRQDELVETTFDVVTYSQLNANANFIRREEFRAVSCQCTLRVPDASGEGGHRPTVWTGNEYEVGELVSKPYGESASNQQSILCEVCCRDHHDGGTGAEDDPNDPGRARFDPFKGSAEYWDSGSLSGDHQHYSRSATGGLQLAVADGDRYLEACRLVRKDGFFKVAQDLRAESVNDFPASYFASDAGVDEYSRFVTEGTSAFEAAIGSTDQYEAAPPSFVEPSEMNEPANFPGSSTGNAVPLPTATGATNEQLQSRGLYVDYLSDELRVAINCLDVGGLGDDCGVPGVSTALEIIPFYDVQLTWLARWTETPNNNPVDVTNEAVETDNAHTRGLASLGSGFGYSTVNASAHKGNLGLTATDPIDPYYEANEKDRDMYILAIDSSSPPPLSTTVVSGDIASAVNGVKAADVEVTSTGAQCDRTNTGFECVIETGATSPRMTVSNYPKANKTLVACSDVLSIHGSEIGSNPWTRFNLPLESTSVAHIVIKENYCN